MKHKSTYRRLLFNGLVCFLISTTAVAVHAQVLPGNYSYPNNHLDWFTLEGDHFLIHYQNGNEKEATYSLLHAENVYAPITQLYDHTPSKKVSIVLRDRTDYSNGAAYFFDDKIEIWLPPLNSPFRGSQVWLRNVITHEFAHIVQLGAAMKRSQTIPAIYLQWLSYEDVRRPDILYGYPKTIITHPFATVSIPAWFAEGTAQFQRDSIYYDFWDSHRDMMLRTAVLSDRALDLTEMGHFSSKTSREREMVYNQGFDFTSYLANRFGESSLSDFTRESSKSRSGNFQVAMESTTGIRAESLYEDWMAAREKKYRRQISGVTENKAELIEAEGFLNLFPQFGPDGKILGYLSNRGRDFAQTRLVLTSGDSTLTVRELGAGRISEETQGLLTSIRSSSNIALDLVSTRFSFSPKGKQIVYSRRSKNKFGEQYNDLYLYNISTGETTQLTENARMHDPAWHPSEELIAAIQFQNGTHALNIFNIESRKSKTIARLGPGETLYTPVWSPDGRSIYYSVAYSGKRKIYRIVVDSEVVEPILDSEHVDFRDPWIDPENKHLYFSSDHRGIFNIYRKSMESGEIQKLTDRIGGAFMPFAANDSLYFSDYRPDGYKIAKIALPEFREFTDDTLWIPASGTPHYDKIRSSSDPLEKAAEAVHKTLLTAGEQEPSTRSIPVQTESSLKQLTWQPFDQVTTGLSVTPVIRFDNYSKLNGSNSNLLRSGELGRLGENILRDVKTGAYFSTRNVLENVSFFGGALFGFGSRPVDNFSGFFSPGRLNNLDRDLFFIIEHNGLPFIQRSWSPSISLELYNIQRNVADGLTIEEFPCTSCLPEEKSIDIRYRIWEANLFLRSKLNRWSLLELGASYSPSTVATDGFFSDEFRQFIPGSSTEYFRGSGLSMRYIADLTQPTIHQDIVPEGLLLESRLGMERGDLLERYELNEGSLDPIYKTDINYSGELDMIIGFTIHNESKGMIASRAFSYFNRPEDFFYLDYSGGLSGMRSYPYFAIGGQRTFFSRFSFFTPLKTDLSRQMGAYTFDKLYGHLFFEAGNGWGGPLEIGSNLKSGIGAELRLSLQGYYNYPLKLFINAAYGLNRFDVNLPDSFIRISGSDRIQYGREVLFYFGLTFDFNRL